MATVNLKVGGRDYQVACDDGQEEQLRFLADEVDDRVRSLAYSMGANPNESMGLLLAALTLADELIENKKEKTNGAAPARTNGAAHNKDAQRIIDARMQEAEAAMAITLDEIAARIETIAGRIEMR